MATPHDKLAASLEALGALQRDHVVAIRSSHLSRADRERLVSNGFLQQVMRGWYLATRPDEIAGESTSWYAHYWAFCAAYLGLRFGTQWSLSPEQSILIHTGNLTIPQQLLVRSPKARNKPTPLAFGTSLFDTKASLPPAEEAQTIDGLRVFSLASALIEVGPSFYTRDAVEAKTALATINDVSKLLRLLLEDGKSVVAGRIAGAFRQLGQATFADDISKTMKVAGYTIREYNPFATPTPILLLRHEQSAPVNRIRLMWADYRETIIEHFVAPTIDGMSTDDYLKAVDDNYVNDAYHSLSIEGYQVSRELIERVRSGDWSPDLTEGDRDHSNGLAARGYYQAFQRVKGSVRNVLQGDNAGDVVEHDHSDWYRELFGPSVQAGILKAAELAGYRNGPVYIRDSTHVPPQRDVVRDLMPALFELLREETEPSVRIVLGHYVFRLYPSVFRWQWSHGSFFDERHDGCRPLSVDSRSSCSTA